MYPVGAHYAMPSPVEIRKMYAGSKAEAAGAAAIEDNKAARAVVDDVNFVRYEMSRLDQSSVDTDPSKDGVTVEAQPKKLNFLQKFTGIGASPVEEIALASEKEGQVSTISGTLSDKEMDVVVSFADKADPLVYSKIEADDGSVFFQRGNETVGIDVNGNLVMQDLS